MIYGFDSRVRYSEVGEDKKITMPSIVNYFQDCSIFHSEAAGSGIDTLAKKKQVWFLLSWQISVDRYPSLGEDIAVKTWAYGFKGFCGYRNFVMEGKNGEICVRANSTWVLMNLEKNRPMHVPDEHKELYGLHPKIEMNYTDKKIIVKDMGEQQETFLVQKHHLDMNHHVNNSQYIQMAMEYLPEDFSINQMRAEYKLQAKLGDCVVPFVKRAEDNIVIVLCDIEKNPYVIVEFQG